jgi:alpha-glucosidase (family GH31 glycosyl hydrolase)
MMRFLVQTDWMHWKVQGDWHFDPDYWPDPSAMVKEINGLGMEVMVTVWPFSHNGSLSYDKMLEEGWLTQTVNESQREPSSCPSNNKCPPGVVTLPDGLHGGLVDVTNSGAMDYVWSSKHQKFVLRLTMQRVESRFLM